MKTYAKGVSFERDLLNYLNAKNFACVRSTASGGCICPIDIVAMKNGVIIAVECKSMKVKPKLTGEKLQRFKEWCDKAGAIGLLAWKIKGSKWVFLTMDKMEKGLYEDEEWLSLEDIQNVFGIKTD